MGVPRKINPVTWSIEEPISKLGPRAFVVNYGRGSYADYVIPQLLWVVMRSQWRMFAFYSENLSAAEMHFGSDRNYEILGSRPAKKFNWGPGQIANNEMMK